MPVSRRATDRAGGTINDPATLIFDHAEEIATALWPGAAREGMALVFDEGTRVFVDGLKRGRVEMYGEMMELAEFVAMQRGLSVEEGEALCVAQVHGANGATWSETISVDEPASDLAPAVIAAADAEAEAEASRERGAIVPVETAMVARPSAPHKENGRTDARLLPSAPEAEQGVIASVLLGAPLEEVTQRVRSWMFHIPAHRLIFQELVAMRCEGEPVDFITLTARLNSAGRLDEAGGAAFITNLFMLLPTAANWRAYAALVHEKWLRREMIAAGTRAAERAWDATEEPAGVLDEHEARLRELREDAGRGKLPELRPITLWEKEEALPPEPAQIIHGLLHRGSKFIIGGTSKARKSFALIDLAVSIAVGAPWWGFPTTGGRVAYLNFEIQEFGIARRIRWICQHRNLPMTDNLRVMTLRGLTQPVEHLAEEIIRLFLRLPPFALIVFDPIYKLLGDRDENNSGDITSLLNHIERVAVETGAAIAFGHHFSKGNQAAKEAIDRMSGAGAFARDPDAILTMTAHEQEDCFTIEPTLRLFAPVKPFAVRWAPPIFERDEAVDPAALKQPKTNSGQFGPTHSKASVLDALSVVDGIRPGLLQKQLYERLNMSRATFYRYVAELNKDGKIAERGGLWFRK